MPKVGFKFPPVPPDEIERRFFARVEKTDNCWIWRGSLNRFGYGMFHFRSKTGSKLAHRWLYEHAVGEIPAGLHLHHECVNPRCVNPAHLRPCTARENTYASMSAARRRAERTHCPHGHEYTPENTWRDYKNRRYCRKCHLYHQKARYQAGLVGPKKRKAIVEVAP